MKFACSIIGRNNYYPFGKRWNDDGSATFDRWQFNGKESQDLSVGNLSLLGLYDFRTRYYDPMLGRWFNIDPALQLLNPYLFCGNSPMMYIDENGESLDKQ